MIEELYLFYEYKKAIVKIYDRIYMFFANAKCYVDWREEYMDAKECGLRRPSIDFLIELAEFFETSTDYIWLGVQAEDIEIKREIDEMLERIDRKIEQLQSKKEELLQMKKELE